MLVEFAQCGRNSISSIANSTQNLDHQISSRCELSSANYVGIISQPLLSQNIACKLALTGLSDRAGKVGKFQCKPLIQKINVKLGTILMFGSNAALHCFHFIE